MGKVQNFQSKMVILALFGGSAGYLNVDWFGSNLKSWSIRGATTPVKSIFVDTITYKATSANFPKLVKFGCFSPMLTYCRSTTILGTYKCSDTQDKGFHQCFTYKSSPWWKKLRFDPPNKVPLLIQCAFGLWTNKQGVLLYLHCPRYQQSWHGD